MRKIEKLLSLMGDMRKLETGDTVMAQDELTEEELTFLAAAGTPEAMRKPPEAFPGPEK